LRKELDEMAPRVKIDFLVERPSQEWTGITGLITTELLEKLCVLNDPQTLYVHCGPVGMTKVIVTHFLKNYPKMKLFKF
jgi:NAD(P)H-flavin reductase